MSTPTVAQPANSRQVSSFPDPIPDIIPFGSLTFFSGASGVGKTVMAAEWLMRMRDGKSICGHSTNCPTGFFYLAADRDWSTYQAVFECVDFPDIPHYTLAEDDSLDPEKWTTFKATQLLNSCLDRLHPIPGSLVVIDPVSPLFISGRTGVDRDVAVSLHRIRRIARRRQITLLCMANVVKAKVDPREQHRRPQDRLSGSGAFAAYSDTQVYMLDAEKGESATTLGWVPRRAKAEQWLFLFDQRTKRFIPYEPIVKREPEDRTNAILGLIPTVLTESRILIELIRITLGISKSTIYNTLEILEQRGLVVRQHGFIARAKVN